MPEDPAARSQVTAWMFGALNSIERKRFVRAAWRRCRISRERTHLISSEWDHPISG
jgi:hypothetical protein